MRRLGYFAVLAVLAAGCARPLWMKPGATEDEFARDRYECVREASYVQPPGVYIPTAVPGNAPPAAAFLQGLANGAGQAQALGGMRTDAGMFQACMEARGYTLARTPSSREPAPVAPVNSQAGLAPDPGKFESVISEQKFFFERTRTSLEELSRHPIECGGTGAFISLNAYILALTPWAEEAGLHRGDRIVRIGDAAAGSPTELIAALQQVQEPGPLRVTVVRQGEALTVALPCHRCEHQESIRLLKQLVAAGAAGDWNACLETVGRLTLLHGIYPASFANFEYHCKVGQNRSSGKAADFGEARILYELHRLSLEEGHFEPDGIAKRRGGVLADIAYLRQAGFASLAVDLEVQLTHASEVASAPPARVEPSSSE